MPTATLNGIDVTFERAGGGPPVLFLNGSGSSLAETEPLRAPFAKRCELLAHDQRGLGLTSSSPGPWSMADYAADALALLDHVGWERCRVVGVSFGGMVAQELAVTSPERVERLALVCTSSGGAGGSSYPLDELADLPPDEQARLFPQLLDTRFTPEWLADHDDDRAVVEMRAEHAGRTRSAEVLRGEAAQLAARRGHDVWDRLPRITGATLVASGRYDGIAPPANGEAIAGAIPGAELRLYDGGHLFFVQDRRALPDVIEHMAA